NAGDRATTGNWGETVTVRNLTTNQTLLTAALPYDAAFAGAIAAGAARERSYAFTLPDGAAGVGEVEITLRTDADTQLFEHNAGGTAETNNTATITRTSTLAAYPNLAVSGVTAPALVVGDPATVTVGWTVTNVGSRVTPAGGWTDAVIASGDATVGN